MSLDAAKLKLIANIESYNHELRRAKSLHLPLIIHSGIALVWYHFASQLLPELPIAIPGLVCFIVFLSTVLLFATIDHEVDAWGILRRHRAEARTASLCGGCEIPVPNLEDNESEIVQAMVDAGPDIDDMVLAALEFMRLSGDLDV